MPNVRTLQRSFNAGEVTPEFWGQVTDAKYQSAVASMRNFIPLPHGPAANRPGFQFVREVKDSSKRTRLIPFTYSTTQTLAIELGAGYFRFHTQGGTVLSGGSPYELANPYAEADLFDIHYVQSADVLTLVHPKYAPRELRRLGATNWTLTTISLSPSMAAPTGVAVSSAGFTAAKYTYTYVVTAIAADLVSESVASSSASVSSNLNETGCTNTISWSAVTGAAQYRVYKLQGGLYGYIGQTAGLSIVDDNIAPDAGKCPPQYDDPFLAAGAITSVPVTAGGSGYSVSYTGGAITSFALPAQPFITTGSGWTLTVSDPTGSGASLVVNSTVSLGLRVVTGVTIVSGGSNYTAPVFTLTENGAGVVGFVSPPTYTLSDRIYNGPAISVSDSTGTGAVLRPVVSGGAITGVTVESGGTGYTSPTLTLTTNNGGSGAALGSAVISTFGDYPGAVSYFEQRRVFAGTPMKPQSIWMTKSGTESNMSYSLPVKDEDRISFRVAAREANTIRHVVPLTQLVLLTSSAEWRVTSVNSDAITPTTISVRPQSYIGASNVQPLVINNTLLYGAARGGHVRELAYSWQANGFVTGDLSLRAPHLFDNLTIVDMAWAKSPVPIAWMVSSNGQLLSLTYVPEQQIGAWAHHDTQGNFLSCCVVSEGNEDVLYVVVGRSIGGVYRQYVERMASRQFAVASGAFFVDSGLTYTGSPATTITGLGHLEGQRVNILADGAVHPQRVVTSGSITLDNPASTVTVGLPIYADLQTLPAAMQVDGGFGQGRAKNVNRAWLRVYRSSGIFVGPDEGHLVEAKQRTTEPYGSPPALKSDEIQIVLTPAWASGGQIYIRQSDPLPLTLVSLTLEVALGG